MNLFLYSSFCRSMRSCTCTLLFCTCFLTGTLHLNGQYFQQHVEYEIEVNLDTRRHMLRGQWSMTYTNNSPDTLEKIIMHLYPNAYSSRSTAFAKQQLRLGNTEFHFAEPADRGAIDSLDFVSNGERIEWLNDEVHPDIAHLNLNKPLLPGESIEITSSFRVKIPRAFSRLGRINDTYQLTQWYPKPAVYDDQGWHPLPYLDQGEFYSEFGSFDIKITLPAEYIVAATGELQTPEASLLLDSLASARNAPLTRSPRPGGRTRTWRYRADHVHDFAWFADTRFAVRKEALRLNEHDIYCWAFFTIVEQPLWEHATTYLKDALVFYSEHIGPYPYPQMTAVQVPLGSGFGMEYPMITTINIAGDAKTLDDVLAHEAGHNWFYGALASNERKHPWMDEGINTFYEHKYLRQKYGTWSESILLHKPTEPDELSDEQRILQHLTRENKLVAPDSDPEFMTDMQNYFGSYFKPALAFDMLEEYMGEALFRKAMQEYYTTWKFRHPQPADLKEILTDHCQCDLSWLFDGLLGTDELIDYRIIEFDNNKLILENVGEIPAPVHVIAFRDGKIIDEEWFDGFSGRMDLNINVSNADRLQVYKEIYTLDLTPSDNVITVSAGNGSKSKLRLRIFGGKQYPGEKYLNLLPILGWNRTDEVMAGIALSNTYWPPGNLQWAMVPLFSTSTNSLVGLGEIQYQFLTPSEQYQIELGLGVKSFHFAQDTHYNFFDRYLKIAPRITLSFGDQKSPDGTLHELQYRYVYVGQEYGRGIDFENYQWESTDRSYSVHELKYTRSGEHGLGSGRFSAMAHAGRGFLRLSADVRHKISYDQSGSAVFLHAFGGILPVHDTPEANVNFHFNGIQSPGIFSRDFLYDELLLSRSAGKGVFSQLVFLKDAQLKTLYTGGLSERWMVGAGISVDLPFPLPLQPYLDVALYRSPFEDAVNFSYSGGVALVVQKDVLEVFIPIVESADIRNSLTYLERDTIFKRISILLDLKALHPFGFNGY